MKPFHFLVLLLLSTYKLALPGYDYRFPADHGSHPDYKLEWWYFTGHLETAEGRFFGYELTFFRTGLENPFENPSRWRVDDLYPAHLALSDLQGGQFYYYEKLTRRGPGLAGANEGTLEVFNQNWSARMVGDKIELHARDGEIELDLSLKMVKPPIIHGRDGVSQKAAGAGRASHYYSLTRLETTGSVGYKGKTFSVKGSSWMDHEFGTNQLAPEQTGWDWFSLQLDNGEELMLYQLRQRDGSVSPFSSGTVVTAAGESQHLEISDFSVRAGRDWVSPRSEGRYPVEWTIEIPSLHADLKLRALLDDQELNTVRTARISYWEGAVAVEGTWRGRPVRGRAYVEMTGYAADSRPEV